MASNKKPLIIFSSEELSWIHNTAEISPQSYFDKFRPNSHLSQKEHQRYSHLLRKADISEDHKERLRHEFNDWKVTHASQFWADRSIKSSAIRTSAKLVKGSEPFADQSLIRNASKAQSNSQCHGALGTEARNQEEIIDQIDDDQDNLCEPSTSNQFQEGEPRPKRKLKPVNYAEEESIEDDEDEGLLYTPSPHKSRRSEQPQLPANLASSSITSSFSAPTSTSAPASSSAPTSSSALTSSSTPTTVRATSTKDLSPKKHRIATPFTENARRSFGHRFNNLGEKWILKSGTVVENILYNYGMSLDVETFSPAHSFMIDLDDPKMEALFSPEDWQEILSDLPTQALYSEAASDYLDSFSKIKSVEELEVALENRPRDQESLLIFNCLNQWVEIFKINPSPFDVVDVLSEQWWLVNAWGLCARASSGVANSVILPGEKTGVESAERRNQNLAPKDRKKLGYKTDLIWRTLGSPSQDWAVAEAAPDWDPISNKYKFEGTFKLPRHMHDILSARTAEVGGPDRLRSEFISGLIIGGPVIQRTLLCWGTSGSNVTRLLKQPERRLHSEITRLNSSLDTIHEVLFFRSSTIRMMNSYNKGKELLDEERRASRRSEARRENVSVYPRTQKFRLLSRSP